MPEDALRRAAAGGEWRDRVVVAALLWINGIVLLNALLHSPFVGYDALDHLRYIDVLAGGRLPGEADTTEFFAAPLPYVVPALLQAFATDRWGVVVKAAQLQNVAWSIGLTLMLVRLCRLIGPGDRTLVRWALGLLAVAPVYYKTFAFVRGEPLAAFLSVVVVERALSLAAAGRSRVRGWAALGLCIGLLLLAKQWGAFVVVAVFAFLAWHAVSESRRRAERLSGIAVAVLVSTLACGWYYLSLHQRFGSAVTFNSPAADGWSLSNRPAAFYTDLGLAKVFVDPVREAFAVGAGVALLPVFYADFWGDYWCYWAVHAHDPAGGWASGAVLMDVVRANPAAGNLDTIAPYLGRVNAVALLPTAVVLAGAWLGLVQLAKMLTAGRATGDAPGLGLAAAVLTVTAGGYFYLLVGYPALDVKAGYLLHIVPFAAVLGAAALSRVATTRPLLHRRLGLALLLAGLHNAPLFFTRYVW